MNEYPIIITSNTEGDLVLNNYEKLLSDVKNFIKSREVFLIQNKSDYSLIKEYRTATNKLQKAIADGRKQVKEELLETFETHCKTLETMLEEHSKSLGEAIKLYDEANGKIKPKKYSVTLKFTDEKLIEKLKTFAEKNGCELTIKD